MDNVKQQMLQRVAQSDAHFKHQQRGDPDLTHAEKFQIARDVLESNPCTFLSRFSKYLTLSDVAYFKDMRSDYTVNFYISDIEKQQDSTKNKTKVRNRRYEAMRQLRDAGDYFSDNETKTRDPLLYEQMVGRYLSDEEVQKQAEECDGSISKVLMQHIESIHNNELYARQALESQMEEEEEDDEKIDVDEDEESELEDDEPDNTEAITDQEKLILRQEFTSIMEQRFLAGQDEDFDYSTVDDNVEYDSVEIRGQDEEEKYFDEEEEFDDDVDLNHRLSECAMDNTEDDSNRTVPDSPHVKLDRPTSRGQVDEDARMENSEQGFAGETT